MICISIFDKTEKNRKLLRDWIADYTMKKEIDIDLLWFTKEITIEKFKAFAFKSQLALVSVDDASGIRFGKMLYSFNPECRIIYYSSKEFDISKLLFTRPAGVFLRREGNLRFMSVLNNAIEEIKQSSNIFVFETRGMINLIPMTHILYLQSDLKYVIIHTLDEEIRIYSKLSQLAEKLNNEFVRIHKSFIVNFRFIESVNKKQHTVNISNGQELPVSAVNYDSALKKIRKLGALI